MTWFKKLFKAATSTKAPEPPVEQDNVLGDATIAPPKETPPKLSKPFKRVIPPDNRLGDKQRVFTIMIAELIQYAYAEGYELTVGDFYREPKLHGTFGVKNSYSAARSVHKVRLAADLNLFKDGKYLTSTEDHKFLGEYWEAMGGTWGGRFSSPDGNHYSLPYQGAK